MHTDAAIIEEFGRQWLPPTLSSPIAQRIPVEVITPALEEEQERAWHRRGV
jgi:hypothetical protein